jgi:Amt family ammonium transporter
LNRTVYDVITLNTEVMDLESTVNAPVDSGDTAWMLFATALVLLMTLPGIVLYYAGMSKSSNVLTMSLQLFTIVGLVTVEWFAFGYSLAFGPPQGEFKGTKGNEFYGDGSRLWLRGMKLDTANFIAPSIPEAIFVLFQLTCAILCISLILGGVLNRMKYSAFIVFQVFFLILVYCPLAHSVIHPDGWIYEYGAVDYAGGLTIFIPAGMASMMAALLMGCTKDWCPPSESHPPHNILLTVIGAALLWVGWIGLNAGHAYSSGMRSSYAAFVTMISASVSSLMYLSVDTIINEKPSITAILNGAIAGLVVITPCSGYTDFNGAFWIGFFGGPLCYFGSQFKHSVLGFDDALDSFGVYAWGGMIGTVMVGFFAMDAVSQDPAAIDGIYSGSTRHGGHLLAYQMGAALFCPAYAGIMSLIILKLVDMTIGLKADEDEVGITLERMNSNVPRSSLDEIVIEGGKGTSGSYDTEMPPLVKPKNPEAETVE